MGIKDIRRAKNITQQELADKIGVNYTVVSKYESGKIKPPSDKLLKIAKVLNVSVDKLFDQDTAVPLEEADTEWNSRNEDKLVDGTDLLPAQYVIWISSGVCELCGQPAPFKMPDGSPYLETHLIKWVSQGGAAEITNIVALCPNCHAKIHVLNRDVDIEKLKKNAANHMNQGVARKKNIKNTTL